MVCASLLTTSRISNAFLRSARPGGFLRLPGATAAARRAAAAVWRRDLPLLLRSGGLLPGGADRGRRCTSGVARRYDCPVEKHDEAAAQQSSPSPLLLACCCGVPADQPGASAARQNGLLRLLPG